MTTPHIYNYQQTTFKKLLAIARAQFSGQLKHHNIKGRTNILISGASGCGKSHLALAAAKELKVPIISLSVSEWILLGCSNRGSQVTWRLLFDFLIRNRMESGMIVFIDEVDKIGGQGSDWNAHLRNELFMLLDKRLPEGLTDENDDMISPPLKDRAFDALNYKTLIIGAGAFQHIWTENQSTHIGFDGSRIEKPVEIEISQLWKSIPMEFSNRFRRELLCLPEPKDEDYQQMLEMAAKDLPEPLASEFLQLGRDRIPEALRARQGARFIEEILVDAIMRCEPIPVSTQPSLETRWSQFHEDCEL